MNGVLRRLVRLEAADARRSRVEAAEREAGPEWPPELVAWLHHGPHAPLPPDLRAGVDRFLAEYAAASNSFRGLAS